MVEELGASLTMTNETERHCECFGDSGLCASTFRDKEGRRCCDQCGWPIKPASFDGLKAVNVPSDHGEEADHPVGVNKLIADT
jgi:hypothetical protein